MSLCSSHSHNHSHSHSHSHSHEALHEVPSMEEQIRASESFKKGVLVAAHMAHLHDAYILEMATHPMTVLPPKPASPSSLPALEGFRPLRLRELKEGKVHRRRFIQGTLSVQSLNMHVVANILEDEDGNAVNLWIRNAVPRGSSTSQAQRLFPQGSRVSIREPYLTRSPSGVLVLLVEKPQDLIFLWVPEDIGHAQEQPSESTPNGSSLESSSEEYGLPKTMPEKQDVEKDEESVEEKEGKSSNDSAYGKLSEASCEGKNDTQIVEETEKESKPVAEKNGRYCQDAGIDIVQSIPNGSSVESSCEGAMPEKQEAVTQKVEDVEKEKIGEEKDDSQLVKDIEKEGKSNTDYAYGKFSEASYDGKSDTQKVDETEKEGKTAAENNGDLSESSCGGNQVFTRELDPYSGLSATELRLRGNRLFSKGDLGAAAELYSRSIQKARSEDDEGGEVVDETGEVVNAVVMGLSNRAEVWLRLKKFDAALEDAETALAEKGAHLKSLFRKARSLMGLQRYEEALVLLKNVQERSPKDADVKAALLQCRAGMEKKPKPGKKKRVAAQKQQQKLSS